MGQLLYSEKHLYRFGRAPVREFLLLAGGMIEERIQHKCPVGRWANTRISSVGASHVSRAFLTQNGRTSKTHTQNALVGVSHVYSPHSTQIGCRTSANTRVTSIGASHVSSPYYTLTGCRSTAKIPISSVGASNVTAHIQGT